MLVTDGKGLPLGLLVEAAGVAEVTLAEDTLATIHVPQRRGRPKTRPRAVKWDSYRLRRHRPEGTRRSDAWRHNFRRLLVRYAWSRRMFEAFVVVAFILLCWRPS